MPSTPYSPRDGDLGKTRLRRATGYRNSANSPDQEAQRYLHTVSMCSPGERHMPRVWFLRSRIQRHTTAGLVGALLGYLIFTVVLRRISSRRAYIHCHGGRPQAMT